jgi:hypothetical protein
LDRVVRSREAAPNPGKGGKMGRGRQKAKDAKIARQIKYGAHGADLRELERELVVGPAAPRPMAPPKALKRVDNVVDDAVDQGNSVGDERDAIREWLEDER